MFLVGLKLSWVREVSTLVGDPVVFGSVEIIKIDCVCMAWVFVEEFPMTMNLILLPVSLISQLTRSIVKLTLTLHTIEVPVALVVTTVLEDVFTLAMTESFQLLPLVFGMCAECLLRSDTGG